MRECIEPKRPDELTFVTPRQQAITRYYTQGYEAGEIADYLAGLEDTKIGRHIVVNNLKFVRARNGEPTNMALAIRYARTAYSPEAWPACAERFGMLQDNPPVEDLARHLGAGETMSSYARREGLTHDEVWYIASEGLDLINAARHSEVVLGVVAALAIDYQKETKESHKIC
jgi:hypothetical protein